MLLSLSIFGLGDLLSRFEREGCALAALGCTVDLQTATTGGFLDAALSTLGVVSFIAAGFCPASAMKRIPGWSADSRPTSRAAIAMTALPLLDEAAQSIGLSGLFERLNSPGRRCSDHRTRPYGAAHHRSSRQRTPRLGARVRAVPMIIANISAAGPHARPGRIVCGWCDG